jgi:oxalate decarboxylase/phosphoglucose isomerase-like protein (cupin superfamily)
MRRWKIKAKVILEKETKKITEFGGIVKEYVIGDTVHFLVGYFKPGEAMKAHYHVEPEEVYYVIKGKAEVLLRKKWVSAGQGTAIYIPPHLIHALRNSGTEVLVMAFLHAPPEKGTMKLTEPNKK